MREKTEVRQQVSVNQITCVVRNSKFCLRYNNSFMVRISLTSKISKVGIYSKTSMWQRMTQEKLNKIHITGHPFII
jgi:hypothetical protein